MKKITLLMITLALITGQSVTAQTYTINDFINAVKDHNKDLKLASRDKDLASIQKKEAISTALPKVGLSAGYNRNITDYYMYFDASAFMPGSGSVIKAPVKRDNEYSATLALQQTLFSPQVGIAIRAANQYQKLTDYVYDASMQNILTASRKMFYQCLLLEKVVGISRNAEQNAKENYDLMKLKFDNGQISELQLLQAETRWKSAIPETRKAERNHELAINVLKNLAGLDPNKPLTISGEFGEIPPMPEMIGNDSVLDQRPDYNALRFEEKLRQTNVVSQKSNYLPTLSGSVAYAFSAQSNQFELAEQNKLLVAGLSLSLPLYTGGYRSAEVHKAQVELDKTRINMDKTRENISNSLSNIYLILKEAGERIETAEATLKTAKKAFNIAESTNKDGLTTQLELKDTRLVYDQATLNYYNAIYDYLSAYFDWELATGTVN